MANNPELKALARQASAKIKALSEAHQTQIEAVYRQFREQAAQIQEGSADELHSPSVTPTQSTARSQKEQ